MSRVLLVLFYVAAAIALVALVAATAWGYSLFVNILELSKTVFERTS